MDDVLWREWWDRTGEAHVRKVLLENWDPIEVAPAVRRGEWTPLEYDAYVAAVGRVLRDMRGSAGEIADCLVKAEREDIGFVGDRQRAKAVAQRIAAWYADVSFPNNRAAAVDYARRVAQQIVDGDYGNDPGAIFGAAHALEFVLCSYQWLDNEHPDAIRRFVEGWSTSSENSVAEIRAAAVRLASDRSPSGPALPPHSSSDELS